MSDATLSTMHDARDAEDQRLLDAGETNALVSSYYEVIIQRCRVRCRSEDDALDCAQAVALRLLTELKRGRRYAVPYRVVVNQVIGWTVKGFYKRGRVVLVEMDDDIPEDVFVQAGNPYADWETRHDLERALAELPERARQVAELRLVQGKEIEEIAAELGMKRNAVDQALYRACTRLQELYA